MKQNYIICWTSRFGGEQTRRVWMLLDGTPDELEAEVRSIANANKWDAEQAKSYIRVFPLTECLGTDNLIYSRIG